MPASSAFPVKTSLQKPVPNSTQEGTGKENLAIKGGPQAVTAPGPASHGLGPQEIGEEEIAAVTAVLRSKNLFRFFKSRDESYVAKMEDLFAEKSGAAHVLAVNSGTSALIAGLVGIGVSQGDEVLVPAYTYIATAAAILALGAFPVMVEIDGALTMDPIDAEKKVTPRTKAIVPVHMRGVPCDMGSIMALARRKGLKVLEDCAQANGGFYKGTALGLLGDAGAYSFQHFKIITSGEGGLLVTNRKEIFDRAAIYHDSAYTFWMERNMEGGTADSEEIAHWKSTCFLGENYRQSEVHGAIGFEQLKKRDAILARTRAIKKKLGTACKTLPGITPEVAHDAEGDCGISLAFFAESAQRAKEVAAILQAEGIRCGTRFSLHVPDRHLFYHWDYIMEKRSPHRNGFPWTGGERPCQVEYSKEMCPATLDWMSRAIFLSISHQMSDRYVDEICQGMEKVGKTLA